MNLRTMFTRTLTPPPSLSERDRVAAELEYETGLLPELKLLVRLGRRPQDVLDAKEQYIEGLADQLNSLNSLEAKRQDIKARQDQELPKEEGDLRAEVQDFVADVLRLRAKADALQQKHDSITSRFSDYTRPLLTQQQVPMKNRLLLPLVEGDNKTLIGIFTDRDSVVGEWLEDAREAGFVVPNAPVVRSTPTREHAEMKVDPDDTAVRAQGLQDKRAEIERERIEKIRKQKAA